MPEVAALEVHGTPWAIPRVHPDHFSASEFHAVIENVAQIPKTELDDEGYMTARVVFDLVDFVWVDVACIDQRFGDESMLEIGRQADIFRYAEAVYIWLSSTTYEAMDELSQEIRELTDCAFFYLPDYITNDAELEPGVGATRVVQPAKIDSLFDPKWLATGLEALVSLCKDTWFMSLWTLQEAYLRPDAYFFAKDGQIVVSPFGLECLDKLPEKSDDQRIFCLYDVLDACDNVRVCIQQSLDSGLEDIDKDSQFEPAQDILKLMSDSGLVALSHENPMELYAAAVNRNPSRILDSIYGIMQVFGFRLGRSNPHSKPDVVYTLGELEDELGAALMQLSPVLSQCFRHVTWPRERGKSWRVMRNSTVPGRAFTGDMPWSPDMYTSGCTLGTRRHDGLLVGHFEGKLCDFTYLKKAWDLYDTIEESYHVSDWRNGKSPMCIVLDAAPGLFPYLERSTSSSQGRGRFQYFQAIGLISDFKADELKILHLGLYEPRVGQHCHFGVILLRQRGDTEPCWRRLGICTWDIIAHQPGPSDIPVIFDLDEPRCPVTREVWNEHVNETQLCWGYLSVQGSVWQTSNGIFG